VSDSTARWRVPALVAAAVVSLATAAGLGIYADDLAEPESVAADGYSRSAIGHAAFVALLRQLGFKAELSRSRTAEKTSEAVLVVAEPVIAAGETEDDRAMELARDASRMLVVLPKRWGAADRSHPRWLGFGGTGELAAAQRVLDRLVIEGTVVRPTRSIESGDWAGPLPAPTLDAPQLIRSDALTPLVSCADGILAGEVVDEDDEWHVVVLADPDIIATHGLGRGDNAVLAVRLLERLGAPGLPVIIDETLHGHEVRPSLARELFRFPLVLATAQTLVVGVLLVWAALVRFGRPRAEAPPLGAGTAFLVDRSAALLRQGGHLGAAVQSYFRAARDEIAARLRPPGEAAEQADRWLARVAAARGRSEQLAAVTALVVAQSDDGRAAGAQALRAAREIHSFREEMTDGAGRDRNSRP